MVSDIVESGRCCGCTACANVCPQKCIAMQADAEGFLRPVVDADKCIECGRCEKVCPQIHKPSGRDVSVAAVTRNRDAQIVRASSSGGFFSALCAYTIRNGGVVYGAAWGPQFQLSHMAAETMEECAKFRGSKYVQSELNDIFCSAKRQLEAGRLVCFSGTPCQIAGLSNFLGKEYDNLILVDFVCHGVPSAALWNEYRKWMEKRYGSQVIAVNFRSKRYGYQSSAMELKFANGKTYCGTARVDMMLKSFFSHISLRSTCYSCNFKGEKRPSDFTVYDCWHAEGILGKKDDDLGYTSVLVRGEKGCRILDQLKSYLEVYEKPIENVLPVNGGMLVRSAKKNPNRDKFYRSMAEQGLENTFDRYVGVSTADRIAERCKGGLNSLGILQKISRFRKRMKKKKEQKSLER